MSKLISIACEIQCELQKGVSIFFVGIDYNRKGNSSEKIWEKRVKKRRLPFSGRKNEKKVKRGDKAGTRLHFAFQGGDRCLHSKWQGLAFGAVTASAKYI